MTSSLLWPRSLDPGRRSLLLGSLLAVTLHAFDELAVMTALPLIVEELGGRSLYGAVFFGYLLASVFGLVAAGWFAARYGPTRPFALGLVLFALGLIVSATAPSMAVVVLGRTLQGFGGGTLTTVVWVVIHRAFDHQQRPHVLALVSAAWVVPSLLAPGIGGWIAEGAGWRWVFWGLLPLTAMAAVLALPRMRALAPTSTADDSPWRSLLLAATLAGGAGVLLSSLGRALSWPTLLALLAGGSMALWSTVQVFPRGTLLLQRGRPAALATKTLLAAIFFGAESFVPLVLVDVHGAHASFAGTVLTVTALSWTAGAFLQARLATSWRAATIIASGSLLVSVALVIALPAVLPTTSPWLLFLAWLCAGTGMGLAYTTCNLAAMSDSPATDQERTSTSMGVADALGISIGTGLGGAFVRYGDHSGWSTGASVGWFWVASLIASGVLVWMSFRAEPRS